MSLFICIECDLFTGTRIPFAAPQIDVSNNLNPSLKAKTEGAKNIFT